MTAHGLSLVISAPSGAGKSTLCKRLLEEFPSLSYSISCATRAPRPGEVDGVDYHFISRQEFLKLVKQEKFVEWAEVHGNFYGTPIEAVESRLHQGLDVLFDVDVQGALRIKNKLPGSVFLFILPPTLKELEKRLITRGKDTEDCIKLRLKNALAEIPHAAWYDYIVINDGLEDAYNQLRAMYVASRHAASRSGWLIDALLKEKQAAE